MASLDSAGKQKSFERVWVRFAEKTSMQGIPYIHSAKLTWAKIAWVILTLIAIVAMAAHLYYLIDQFYSWPKQTKISLGFNNLRFPDVTICNTNIIKHSAFMQFRGAEELKSVMEYLGPDNPAPGVRGGDSTGSTGCVGRNTGGETGDTAGCNTEGNPGSNTDILPPTDSDGSNPQNGSPSSPTGDRNHPKVNANTPVYNPVCKQCRLQVVET